MDSYARRLSEYTLIAALAFTNIFVWYAVSNETRDGVLVAFLDVGQGDAIFIEAPDGSQVLVDGGSGKGVLRALSDVMPFYDRSIDLVVATHPDADHIGGLSHVLDRYRVSGYLESGASADTAAYRNLEASLGREQGLARMTVRRGMTVALASSTILAVLFPDRDASGFETNDASIIMRLDYGKTSFLLTGDAPQKIEEYVVALDHASVNVDVLKAGHHGSKTSTSDTLLGWASPIYAVISAGKDNRYGHPHAEVLEKLKNSEIEIVRTDEHGTVRMKSNGSRIMLD